MTQNFKQASITGKKFQPLEVDIWGYIWISYRVVIYGPPYIFIGYIQVYFQGRYQFVRADYGSYEKYLKKLAFTLDEKSLEDRCFFYWEKFLVALAGSIDDEILVEKANQNTFRQGWLDGEFIVKYLRRSKRLFLINL